MALTTEQLKKIKSDLASAEKSLIDATAQVNMARRAGIDVADNDAQINELRGKIRKMKAVYGG